MRLLRLLARQRRAMADPRDEALSASAALFGHERQGAAPGLLRFRGGARARRVECACRARACAPAANGRASAAPPPRRMSAAGAQSAAMASSTGCSGPAAPSARRRPRSAQFGSESIANGGTPRLSHRHGRRHDRCRSAPGWSSYELSSGYLIVTLDNGQVWRQVSRRSGRPSAACRPLAYAADDRARRRAAAYDMKLSHVAPHPAGAPHPLSL